MKRFVLCVAVAVAVFYAPVARAQDHAEIGAFVDYFKLQATGTNFVGLGGRAAVNVTPNVQLEAEMAYDFQRVFTESFSNGATVTTSPSSVHVLHGLFGPKIQTKGPVRIFGTVKGGAVNFGFGAPGGSFSGFTSSVSNLRANDVSGVFYPGGGVEAFLGPIGLRAEVGDEIIFSNGAHSNWKVTFGPQIRF